MNRIGEGKLSMYSVFISSKLRNYGGGNFGPWVSSEMFFFSFCLFIPFQFPIQFFYLNLVLQTVQSLMSVDAV